MTKQEKVAAWITSLGYEKSPVHGYRKWYETDKGSKFEFLTDNQATFFYDVMAETRIAEAIHYFGKPNLQWEGSPKNMTVTRGEIFARIAELRHLKQKGQSDE